MVAYGLAALQTLWGRALASSSFDNRDASSATAHLLPYQVVETLTRPVIGWFGYAGHDMVIHFRAQSDLDFIAGLRLRNK